MSRTEVYLLDIAPNPGLRIGPEIVFTPEALGQMLDFMLTREPECGGIGTGPMNRAGIDRFIPDPVGSENASYTVYSPDAEHLNAVTHSEMNEGREMHAIIHKHPGNGSTMASREAGYGRGDYGYARKYFDMNEAALFLQFPILTSGAG